MGSWISPGFPLSQKTTSKKSTESRGATTQPLKIASIAPTNPLIDSPLVPAPRPDSSRRASDGASERGFREGGSGSRAPRRRTPIIDGSPAAARRSRPQSIGGTGRQADRLPRAAPEEGG